MLPEKHLRLLDPTDRLYCHFIDAIVGSVVGDIAGGVAADVGAGLAADVGGGLAADVGGGLAAEAGGLAGIGGEAGVAGGLAPALAGVTDFGAVPGLSAVSTLGEAGGGVLGAVPGLGAEAGGVIGAGTGLESIGGGIGTEIAGGAGDIAGAASGGLTAPVAGAGAGALSVPAAAPLATAPSAAAPDFFTAAVGNEAGGAGGLTGFQDFTTQLTPGLDSTSASGPVTGADALPASTPTSTPTGGSGGGGTATTGAKSGSLGDWSPRSDVTGGAASKSTFGQIKDFFKENKDILGAIGGAAPLLSSLFGGNKFKSAAQTQAGTTAANTANLSTALEANALNGVLPAGFENSIEQAKNSAAANIRSTYANLGQSGSTSEANDLAASGAKIEGTRATILQDLLSKGITAAGISGGQNLQLAQLQFNEDQELQKALANLSKSLLSATVAPQTSNTAAA